MNDNFYIIVVQYNRTYKEDGNIYQQMEEEISLTSKLKKKHIQDATIIINAANLTMVKDRNRNYNNDYNESIEALEYIRILSNRNKDVNKIYQRIKQYSKELINQYSEENNV